jgi:hypothetical protein
VKEGLLEEKMSQGGKPSASYVSSARPLSYPKVDEKIF